MNEMVKRIVDLLFAKTVENDETRALHDEVMNNCQEHYADLVARGLNEDDAIHEVILSLKGMEEVIAEYKIREEPEQEAAGDVTIPNMPEFPEFTLDGVKKIRIETIGDDIVVRPSENNQINISYDGMKQTIVAENAGETLKIGLKKINIEGDQKTDGPKTSWRDVFPKHEDGSFSFNLKALGEMISNSMSNVSIGGDGTLTVEIPAGAEYALEANSRGGDVKVDGCRNISELKMNSTSGDVKAVLPAEKTLSEITMNTASGDITVEGSAGKLVASTMSGDVNITGDYRTAALKSVSGDVELKGTIASLTASSVSGDVSLHTENADTQDLHLNSVSGDIELNLPEGSAVNVKTNTVSGDVENRHPVVADAKIRVNAKTTSGDIKVL